MTANCPESLTEFEFWVKVQNPGKQVTWLSTSGQEQWRNLRATVTIEKTTAEQ